MSTLKEKAEQILAEKESKIIPENLRNSVTAFGVAGTYTGSGIDTSDATATANDLAQNKTAYVNGQKITGAVHLIDSNIDVSADSLEDKTSLNNLLYMHITFSEPIMFGENSRGDFHINSTTAASVIGLTPSKIKQGETILGVTGTYEGSGEGNTTINTSFGINGDGASAIKSKITSLPELDTHEFEHFDSFFSDCSSLESIPNIDTSNGKSFYNMFSSCNRITSIPNIDTSKNEGYSMDTMFGFCYNLTHIPDFDTPNVTSMRGMFMCCHSLENFPDIDTSNNTDFWNFFYECQSMVTAPSYDTSSAGVIGSMFYDCTNLENVPVYNTSSIQNTSECFENMFRNCNKLTNESLNNIMRMCINAVNVTTTDYKKLSYLGLTSQQAAICQTLSNYQDFIDAGWTTGY